MQRVLSKYVWEHELFRQQMEAQIYTALHSSKTHWDLDETGFLKAGKHSVGTQRQYTGTAGKTTNCQVAVFLAFSSAKGYALTDFRLYLPESWLKDKARCRKAGIPEGTVFKTKGKLAVEVLSDALAKGYTADWTTGDCVYGDSRDLRDFLVEKHQAFVLAMHDDRLCQVLTQPESILIKEAHASVENWETFRIPGSQGWLPYEWGQLDVVYQGLACQLVFRRRRQEITAFLAWSEQDFSLIEVARAICRRWDIERCFEEAKQEVGLDEYQVRKWQSIHRHLILSMRAFWLLVQVKLLCGTSVPLARRYLRIPWSSHPPDPTNLYFWARFREWHSLKASLSRWRRRLKTPVLARNT